MALSQDNSSKFLSEEEIDTVKEVFILSFAGAFGTALAHSVVEIYREYLRNPNEPKPEEANEPTDNSD